MTIGKSVEEMLKNDLQIEYQVADHLKKAVADLQEQSGLC